MCLQVINICANGANCVFPEPKGGGQRTAVRVQGGFCPCINVILGGQPPCKRIKLKSCREEDRIQCFNCGEHSKGQTPKQEDVATRYKYEQPDFSDEQKRYMAEANVYSHVSKFHKKQEEEEKAKEHAAMRGIGPETTIMIVLDASGHFRAYPI